MMPKLLTKTVLMSLAAVTFAQMSHANELTCYEQYYRMLPSEVRVKQAQNFQQQSTRLGVGLSLTSISVGVGGYFALKQTFPLQDGASNITSAGTTMAAASTVGVIGGQVVIATLNDEHLALEHVRALSDQAYLGEGEELENAAANANFLHARMNHKVLNQVLMRKSIAEAIVQKPSLCATKDLNQLMVNVYNEAQNIYAVKSVGLSESAR